MSSNRRGMFWFLALMAAFVAVFWVAELYTDWLWYRCDAYPVVFGRRIGVRVALLLVSMPLLWAFVRLNLRHAMRSGPVVRVVGGQRMDPELQAWLNSLVEPVVRWAPLVVAVLTGLNLAGRWEMWLLALFGQPFGVKDPQFGLDVGFYVYRLAAWRQLLALLSSLTVISLVGVVLVYAYLGLVRARENELSFSPQARSHILALVALLLLCRAGTLWLERFGLLLKPNHLFYGAGWTGCHIAAPGLALAALLAAAAGVACLLVMRPNRRATPAYWALGLHVLATIGVGVAVPVAQRLLVTPNELDREEPFIRRAVEASRKAFALDAVDERPLVQDGSGKGGKALTAADLARNRGTVDNIRIWDHRPLLRTFAQLQEIRQYYDIIDVDSDRYSIAGRLQQILIGARELNHQQLDVKARSWVNEHIEYTHGYGVVLCPANRESSEGQPEFLVQDIPPRSNDGVTVTEPRIYFGEVILLPPEEVRQPSAFMPQQQREQTQPQPDEEAEKIRRRLNSVWEPAEADYLLVGTSRDEFDYAETSGEQEVKHRTRYQGKSGVPVGGLFRRLLFGVRLHSLELVMTRLATKDSKLLLYRQVTRRCAKAAPFLQWDTNPYPVVAGGRVYWVCEGYTYSLSYPYSEAHFEQQMTAQGLRSVPVWNYVRNPVKAVIDAYDGTISFYIVDPNDPLVRTFQKIYPGMLKPPEQIPAELRGHFRYPVLLFKTQTDMFRRYHMTDPTTFYSGEDLWAVAREFDREAERQAAKQGRKAGDAELYRDMPPYYITMSLPGEQNVQFMLLSPFTPFSSANQDQAKNRRDNLIAWMVALCDPDEYGRLVVYKFPKDTNIYGPLQVEARIDQDDAISQQITLWDKGGSQVIRGSLLIVPIESALLYVQPLYLESDKKGLPELKRVIVAYRDEVVMEPTLQAALERIFGTFEGPGTSAPQATPAPAAEQPGATPPTTGPPATGPGVDPRLLIEAQKAFDDSESALRAGDWTRYEAERDALRKILERLRPGPAERPR